MTPYINFNDKLIENEKKKLETIEKSLAESDRKKILEEVIKKIF